MISPFSDTGLMAAGAAGSRYATSWFPALSSSCSWMMLERSKMACLLWPVRSMATRSGTSERVRLQANRPGFVRGPCSLRREDSGAVSSPHCPPLPNQSGNPH